MRCASSRSRRPLRLPALAGSVRPRNRSGMRVASPAAFERGEHRHGLHQRLAGAAGFRDRDEARGGERQPLQQRAEGLRIEIVHEMQARPSRSAPRPGTAWPASCASVWPPRLDPPVPRKTTSVAPSRSTAACRCSAREVVAPLRQAQQRQRAVGVARRAASRAPPRCACQRVVERAGRDAVRRRSARRAHCRSIAASGMPIRRASHAAMYGGIGRRDKRHPSSRITRCAAMREAAERLAAGLARRHALRAADDGDQQAAVEQALGHAARRRRA